jgi:hypothetical protein
LNLLALSAEIVDLNGQPDVGAFLVGFAFGIKEPSQNEESPSRFGIERHGN